YMCQRRQLRKITQHWKATHANATLATASFFFNARGTELEQSQEGLLRSILHKLLSDDPLLIRQIFHERWFELLQTLEVAHPVALNSWSLSVLKNALAGVLEASNKYVLLFVDGLDEYHGTSCAILIDLMKRLSTSSHVKICVSSRPLQIFEEAFDKADKIRLQDLTAGDIEAFTISKLEANLRFQRLAEEDPGTSQRFYDEIFSKASGVFLWVALAVDLVIDGLCNRDPIPQILAELQSLPSDLKDLYNDMLNRIRPKYQESSVRLFRIMLCMEADRICPLALSLAHDGPAEALEIAKRGTGVISDCDAKGRIDDITVWLKVRCAGLLEIRDYQKSSAVQYIHLTAKEHLSELEILQYRGSQPFPSFNPYLQIIAAIFRLAKAYIALTEDVASVGQHYSNKLRFEPPEIEILTASQHLLQLWARPRHSRSLQRRTLRAVSKQFLFYACLMERKTKQTHTEMFDHMSQVIFRISTIGSNKDNTPMLTELRYDGWLWPLSRNPTKDGLRCVWEDESRTEVLRRWWEFCADDSLNAEMNSVWLTTVCNGPLDLYLKEKARSTQLEGFCADALSCIDSVDRYRKLSTSFAGVLSFCLWGLMTRRCCTADWVVDLVAEIFQREYFGVYLFANFHFNGISLLDKRWASAFRFLAVTSDAFVSHRCDTMQYLPGANVQNLPEAIIKIRNKHTSLRNWTLLLLILSVETSLDARDMQTFLADLVKCGATISKAEVEMNPHLEQYYDKKTAKRKLPEDPEVGVARVRKRLANIDAYSAVLERAESDLA
ncbi:MAG: hypothetical protein Q9184_006730, partial [Pyrenodesmia sp. 2 TL-2023]